MSWRVARLSSVTSGDLWRLNAHVYCSRNMNRGIIDFIDIPIINQRESPNYDPTRAIQLNEFIGFPI